MRLLIIENAPDIADLLVSAFSVQGYAADAALDGEQGVELAEINDYDLVVLDLNLPGLDGLEVCRRIRASRPHTLIVMLTARNRREDIIVGLDEGADDYLVKPFDLGELSARVRAAAPGYARARAAVAAGRSEARPSRASGLAGQPSPHADAQRVRHPRIPAAPPGEVVSQEELLEHVWDAEANPFTNTVLPSSYEPTGDQQPRRKTMARTLLFIDDAPDINSLLVKYFSQAGFDTLGAHEGRSGLELAQANQPDLIVLDLGLPDIDGVDVCRELRRGSRVPIVMLTRRGELHDRVTGLEAGADYYLVKPFHIEELKAVIEAVLRRSTPPAA
jgi:DNA-binding response OmpR family regulator